MAVAKKGWGGLRKNTEKSGDGKIWGEFLGNSKQNEMDVESGGEM